MRAWRGAQWFLEGALCLVLASGPSSAPAQVSLDRAKVLKLVDDHYNHLSSLRCEFSESFSGVGAERHESGTLLLAKPGRMRWSYTEPAGKLFVLDGRYAWSYNPGDAQVQRVSGKQLDDLRSPLRFLLGRTRLDRELSSATVSSESGGYAIQGVPEGMRDKVDRLTLHVTSAGLIEEIRVEERDGSSTQFRFWNVSENVAIPAQTFRFEVPRGVPVVDGLPPS